MVNTFNIVTTMNYSNQPQYIDNCEFISSLDDALSIITVKEATGDWKAIVLRSTDDDDREALLSSESCDSIQRAFECLHAKAAEATAIYIKTNGFRALRNRKDVDDVTDDDTLSVGSTRSNGTGVALSVFDSSDDENVTPASSSLKKKRSTKRSKAVRHTRKYDSDTSSECEIHDESHDQPPIRRVTAEPIRYQPGARLPPPPHGFSGPPPPPPNRDPRVFRMHPSHLPPPPPLGGPPMPAPPMPASGHPNLRPIVPGIPPRLHDVRITLIWIHHGEKRIFESVRPSIRALQDTTLAYIRSHMNNFDNVTPLDHSPNKVWTLRAQVKQAFFGSEACDMSSYRGDDLTKLFNVMGKNDIPRFEMEVDYVRPPGGPIPGSSIISVSSSIAD